ncbi:MAG: sigma-70 family RNA polymerase sigma factor [Brevundimonas sp.]|uniref:RNA polymerase sigma factor n=1 Tax=Brevundimonas sp. TaxID=1871086 RepID=UPI002486FD3C|nr:sigma-70 family RNA polymerase sigma factor [Brevundimonas sp.]MDI1328251.1 sigma-70 family RNA polymerase sigma factor [Brevundimonas sp.]
MKEAVGLGGLYHAYGAWLRVAIIRRYGSQDADDLSQDVWLKVVPYESRREIKHPRAFLLRVASNLIADRLSCRARTARWQEQQSALQPALEWAGQSDELLAKQVITSLPQPLRDVFVLSRFGGLTNSQIAEQLGIRPKTVEWRMTKALAHCAAQFRR